MFALTLWITASAGADDWPQWLGPRRDGVYREAGVATRVPKQGFPVRWRVPAEHGYAGPAVAQGRVFLFDYVLKTGEVVNNPGARDMLTGRERLRALDAATGRDLWMHEYDRPYAVSYGGGPRCTPTVDGDRVYTLGAEGDLKCLDVADGRPLWHVNLAERFGAPTPLWGHSSHPLVEGDTLYCLAGGKGSLVVALDKRTGETRWSALDAADAGYSPVAMATLLAGRQLLAWGPSSLNGLEPATGRVLWSLRAEPSYGMSIHAPRVSGGRVFISALGDLSVLVEPEAGGEPKVVWAGDARASIESVNTTPMIHAGVIYGVDANTSELVALRLEDGAKLWATREPTNRQPRERHGTVFLIRHAPSDAWLLLNDDGELITAELSADGYQETGRMKVLEPTGDAFGRPAVWSHPALAGRTLFARNDKELVAVSLEE